MSAFHHTSKRSHEDVDAPSGSGTQAKRLRQGDGLQKDEEFWEEDGNIVLVARTVEFKVYRGVLAHHSSVFADMFSLPQPRTVSAFDSPDDCPMVHLEDSPEDLRHVLRAILPRKQGKLIHREAQTLSFHAFSAYARLGHKYQIESLVAESVAFLQEHFIDDFDRWCARETVMPTGWTLVDAIGVVNIARRVGCTAVLPGAFAVCCALSAEDLVRGLKAEDGSMERLDEDDLIRCVHGRTRLAQEAAGAVVRVCSLFRNDACTVGLPFHPGDDCSRWVSALIAAMTEQPDLLARQYPFKDWSAIVNFKEFNACKSCKKVLNDRLRAKQLEIWKRLPAILGIADEGWAKGV